jgi:hypothetical protein
VAKILYSQPASNNSTRKKALKTSRFVAKIAAMFENVAAMAERRLALGKCLTLYAHNVERKRKCRSNRAMIVRFCAGIASLPTAAKIAALFLIGKWIHICYLCPDSNVRTFYETACIWIPSIWLQFFENQSNLRTKS